MTVLDFDAAIKRTAANGSRHLLLGNGFSIACRPDLFQYSRLYDEAHFEGLNADVDALFGLTGTTDFERVIEALRVSANVVGLYAGTGSDLAARLTSDAQAVRAALAEVLAAKHPDNVGEVEDGEYTAARRFLSHFDGKLYTLNYDLLLYWTLLQDLGPQIQSDDGFRAAPEAPDSEWVEWDGYAGYSQRVFHLHGGLHLFDSGSSLKKLTWTRTGVPLVEQIRRALDGGTYPLVVTEGDSTAKLTRIEHSPYLHKGLKSLTQCKGTLFVYGHSLAANDDHVLTRIERGKFAEVFVGLHGDPESEDNQSIQQRANVMVDRRAAVTTRYPLAVSFYQSETACVWG